MCRQRIIIEFDDWDYNKPMDEIREIYCAIKDEDYEALAEKLKICDADDIRIENSVAEWRWEAE